MTAEADFSHMHYVPIEKINKIVKCASYVSIYVWLTHTHMQHKQNNYHTQWHQKVKLNLVYKRDEDLMFEAEFHQYSVHYALSGCGLEVSFSHCTQSVDWLDRLQAN